MSVAPPSSPSMLEDATPSVLNEAHINIVLASQSGVKVERVRNFYALSHPNLTVRTLVVDTDYVQPLGIEQAERCVDQRLDAALERADSNTALLVALENYVYRDDVETHRYRDACLLGVRRIHGIVVDDTCFSPLVAAHTVAVPETLDSILNAASSEGGEPLDVTCGALLRNRFGSHPDFWEADWFVATGAAFGRRQQINMLLEANSALLNIPPPVVVVVAEDSST